MYIIGFNGPPRSGKDTFAEMVQEEIESRFMVSTKLESLSFPLREIAYTMTNYWGSLDGEEYERFKVLNFPVFNNDSGRQIMIDISESFLKKCYGQEIMAELLLERNRGLLLAGGILLIRDMGFQCELTPLMSAVGKKNVAIARLMRTGCSFIGDSREFVHQPHSSDLSSYIDNSADLASLRRTATQFLDHLVNNAGWVL